MAPLALGFFTPGRRVPPSNCLLFVVKPQLPEMMLPLLQSTVASKTKHIFCLSCFAFSFIWKWLVFLKRFLLYVAVAIYHQIYNQHKRAECTIISVWRLTVGIPLEMITAHLSLCVVNGRARPLLSPVLSKTFIICHLHSFGHKPSA